MPRKERLCNWGNFPSIQSEVTTPLFMEDWQEAVSQKEQLLVRGNGRCYGDAALSEQALSSLQWNKFLDFDSENGILECQSGVLLRDILEFIVPQGWFLPVTPGTQFITVGGAIAADVHGKNHHREGCFSQHLLHFDLLGSDGLLKRCSPEEHSDLFWDTVGNMGLTGAILQARFRLRPIETAYIRQETIKARNLEEIMTAFEASADWTYTVAWIDCFQKGASLGRSLLMRGEHATPQELLARRRKKALQLPRRRRWKIPFFFPDFALNSWSIRLFNFLFYHRHWNRKSQQIIPYDQFFYPLDTLLEWNKMYGKKGFTQYQFVLPKGKSAAGLTEILREIRQSGQGSFLTVLKLFGKAEPRAIHSFPIEGYTLALDFKIIPGIEKLIHRLDTIVRKYQGRVYRAKDAFSAKDLCLPVDPPRDPKFHSVQAKRYGLK